MFIICNGDWRRRSRPEHAGVPGELFRGAVVAGAGLQDLAGGNGAERGIYPDAAANSLSYVIRNELMNVAMCHDNRSLKPPRRSGPGPNRQVSATSE